MAPDRRDVPQGDAREPLALPEPGLLAERLRILARVRDEKQLGTVGVREEEIAGIGVGERTQPLERLVERIEAPRGAEQEREFTQEYEFPRTDAVRVTFHVCRPGLQALAPNAYRLRGSMRNTIPAAPFQWSRPPGRPGPRLQGGSTP
jgi:hypothetical protein